VFTLRRTVLSVALVFVAAPVFADLADDYAKQVTIRRDEWGVPHISGPTDASAVFGVAYATCEDYFWQVEETMLQVTGRYAEVVGEAGLSNDMQIALWEIVSRSKADYEKLDPKFKAFCDAYAAGYNYYLKTHPEVKPRGFTHYEPYQMLCYERGMMMMRLLGHAHAPQGKLPALEEEWRAHEGSNAWAISGSRTHHKAAMLFINPHQPWFGTGMWTEVHVTSDEGWNMSGATFPGGPFPTMGFNGYCGWAYTVNEPDVGDVYRLTFDKKDDKLAYKYGDGYKHAEEWQDHIKVKTKDGSIEDRVYTFRKSHYGPIMAKEDDTHFLAVKIAKLFEGSRMRQSYGQTKAKNFAEWHAAASALDLQMFNTVYADRDNNIYFLYNGAVPRKDPGFNWMQPVDGSDPKTEWQGIHPIDELPQVLNPISGYVESCNSTPFTATDDGAPSMKDFPSYMVEDKYDDMRRAKVSRYLLRKANDISFDDWQKLAYDTTLYWPMTELPRYAKWFDELKKSNPDLAGRVAPYFEHLLDWDYKATISSTQATLCVEWYEQLYGRGYPVEDLKKEFVNDIPARFQALITAAENLTKLYGKWQVAYGDIHRLQRHPNQPSPATVPFSDDLPSIPVAGVRGPLGVAFTVYDTPATPERKKSYATVGASYMAVVEFGERMKAKSYLHFGQSGDPKSPHFFDQAELLSKQQFKDAWFYADDVEKHTTEKYHPGEKH
jgi:penicillin amidase